MTIANTTILLKKSGVPGNVPSSLTHGELGINYHDGTLFYLNSNNIVSQFITGSNVANTNSFSTINVNSSLILATSPTDILSIVPGNNITISTNTTTKTITIDSTSGGSGSGIDGFARDVANAAYSQANLTNILTQSSYDQANTGTLLAQDAYNFANTIASSSGHSTITDDNTTNNVLYINFTESTSGVLTDIKTSSEKLTYNPYSGTIGVNSINLTANTNMAANGVNLSSLSQVTIDSLPANLYRSAFYQVQISSGLEFHILNLNVVHNDFNVFVNTFGDTYSLETLGSFTASIVDGLLNVQFTPVYSSTTVSFVRNAIAKMGVEVPIGSLGFVGDPVTIFFDAGYDADPVGTQQDYGTVG